MTPLRKRLIQDMQLRNLAPETIRGYVYYVARFAKYFGRSPEQLTPEHARQYQLHLLERKVSWSTFNQSVCALRFFFGTTLGRKDYVKRLPFGKKPKRVPVVLSREEVLKFLQCILSRKQRMLLTTMYATGMRVGEAVELRVSDIDSRRMTILVSRGKGNKQRLVPLSPKLLTELRLFWQTHRNPVWLFPSRDPASHLRIASVERMCARARARGGLKRRFNTHALRHTFATELLEAGVDLFSIQKILGHRSLSTTAHYTHVRRSHLQEACRSLDLLPLEQLRQGPAPTPPRKPGRRTKSEKSSAATESSSSPPADPA
ncbi:MAG TPA: site-specific integrase [Gemmataceae bacterium]|nr:site-specific integrase [Gemmataceae bacterium]